MLDNPLAVGLLRVQGGDLALGVASPEDEGRGDADDNERRDAAPAMNPPLPTKDEGAAAGAFTTRNRIGLVVGWELGLGVEQGCRLSLGLGWAVGVSVSRSTTGAVTLVTVITAVRTRS